jgi:sugar lactone lactonase YvrE
MYLGNNSVLLITSTTGDANDNITIYSQITIGTDTTINSIANNSGSYVFIGGQTYAQQIGSETTTANLKGTSNGYIYAYSTTASPWLQRIGQNNDTSVTRIIYTTDGYVYVAGQTTSTLIGTETTSNLLGVQDGFVAKYGSLAGTFVASVRFSGTNRTTITSMTSDSTYIYICGYTTASQLKSSLVIIGQIFNTICESSATNNIGIQDGFFAKFTTSGEFVMLQRIGEANTSTYITDIKINSIDYVVITGYVEQTTFTSGFVSVYTLSTTTTSTVVASTPIDYCVNKMNRRNRMSMTCTNVQYNKLVTYGNNPQQSQKMAYSRYLRSNKPYTYIYSPEATVVSNSGIIITFAGYGSETGSTTIVSGGVDALVADLRKPLTCAIDSTGDMYICDLTSNRVYKLTVSTNIITPFAGTNNGFGYTGDGGSATEAKLDESQDIAFDSSNNVYICDKNNKCIRKVDATTQIITTICGNGISGYSGDGGDASSATLNYPQGICIDASNNIYIADTGNSVIRKIDATTNIISTIAGNVNAVPTSDLGNGKAATSIEVNLRIPRSVYVDSDKNIYIADAGNRRIRKVDATTQIISTYCGTGNGGFNSDNILATSANLNIPLYVTGDASNIYITDVGYNRVRKINKSTTIITTVIGNGDFEYNGDNIQATSAGINQPRGLGIDTLGNIYVADTLHSRVRKVYV